MSSERPAVEMNLGLRMDFDEMTRYLNPRQIHAVMNGMAEVLAAGNGDYLPRPEAARIDETQTNG